MFRKLETAWQPTKRRPAIPLQSKHMYALSSIPLFVYAGTNYTPIFYFIFKKQFLEVQRMYNLRM